MASSQGREVRPREGPRGLRAAVRASQWHSLTHSLEETQQLGHRIDHMVGPMLRMILKIRKRRGSGRNTDRASKPGLLRGHDVARLIAYVQARRRKYRYPHCGLLQ